MAVIEMHHFNLQRKWLSLSCHIVLALTQHSLISATLGQCHPHKNVEAE